VENLNEENSRSEDASNIKGEIGKKAERNDKFLEVRKF